MRAERAPITRFALRAAHEAAWAPIAIVVLHSITGELFGHEPYVDPMMHFFGGIAVAFFFRRLCSIDSGPFGMPSRTGLDLLAFGLACAAALFWEFGEFFADQWFGTHMQRGVTNTMRDLILGTSGALLYLAPTRFEHLFPRVRLHDGKRRV